MSPNYVVVINLANSSRTGRRVVDVQVLNASTHSIIEVDRNGKVVDAFHGGQGATVNQRTDPPSPKNAPTSENPLGKWPAAIELMTTSTQGAER